MICLRWVALIINWIHSTRYNFAYICSILPVLVLKITRVAYISRYWICIIRIETRSIGFRCDADVACLLVRVWWIVSIIIIISNSEVILCLSFYKPAADHLTIGVVKPGWAIMCRQITYLIQIYITVVHLINILITFLCNYGRSIALLLSLVTARICVANEAWNRVSSFHKVPNPLCTLKALLIVWLFVINTTIYWTCKTSLHVIIATETWVLRRVVAYSLLIYAFA